MLMGAFSRFVLPSVYSRTFHNNTVRRTSTFSAAQTRPIVAILLANLLPGVKADCTIDRFGDEHCTLSVAARVGLSLALVFLLVATAWYMRYRRRRAAQIYIADALQNQLKANNGSGGAGPPNAPQYPPRVHSPGAVPHYTYDPDTGFVPPAHSPPPYYTPPPGALPKGPYRGKGSFPI
ncbi:hypothetical protein EDB92DRAFT_188873 [Lactarius akahatsu]|uniref:Transmembrane protein n=1 Tax=Lactarius akahatsu TaxID=416441 RepID=A0AAD4Q919_9AGAM|nr:hypothetical protein EDB92DRAFT_188873 [Lactarius akahatsu]